MLLIYFSPKPHFKIKKKVSQGVAFIFAWQEKTECGSFVPSFSFFVSNFICFLMLDIHPF